MGKPAARKTDDTAGHIGNINMGSDNVLINDSPAARQGDGFDCSTSFHGGGGIITGGSATVFINGKPAARKGDSTMCGLTPVADTIGVVPAENQTLFSPMLCNEEFDNESYVNAFGLKGYLSDKTGNGSYDTFNLDVPLVIDAKYQSPEGPLGLGGGTEFSVAHGTIEAGLYASKGSYGVSGEAEITDIHYGLNGHVGKEGVLYGSTSGYADIGYADVAAEAIYTVDTEENRYGVQAQLGAEAGIARAGDDFSADILGIVKVEGKIEGQLEAVGAMAGGGWYIDTDDFELNVNASGELAALVGLKGDLSITLSAKPIVNFIGSASEFLGITPSKDGTILEGCDTVLIG